MNELQTLSEFIEQYFESKSDFARQLGCFPQQIYAWEQAGYLIADGVLYKPMRKLVEIERA